MLGEGLCNIGRGGLFYVCVIGIDELRIEYCCFCELLVWGGF